MSSDTHATLLTSMATPVPHPTSRRRTCAPASLMERDTRRCETSCETRLKDLRQQARCAVAVACVHSGRELDRLAAEGAGCSVGARPLAPGDDALLAKDVRAALEHDRRSHRLLAERGNTRVLVRPGLISLHLGCSRSGLASPGKWSTCPRPPRAPPRRRRAFRRALAA